MSGYRP